MPLLPDIKEPNDFFITFSTKEDGNMLRTNETRVAVHNNRLRFLQSCGVELERLFVIRTSHSPNVEVIDKEDFGYSKRLYLQRPVIDTDFDHYYSGSDGALTFNSQLFVGLMSGDCVPLVIWAVDSTFHGILHIGLLGALNGMVRILPQIFADCSVNIRNTRFFLGPAISQRNYNVGQSGLWTAIADQAFEKVKGVKSFIAKDVNGEYFDVTGMIQQQLFEVGIDPSQVQCYPHCIASSDSVFISHNILKQKGERGNFFSIIGREDALVKSK